MARTELYWIELSERLALERAKRGWSAEEAAKRAGLGSKDTVLKAESGERKPSNATIVKLTLVYGMPEDELLRLLRDGPVDSPLVYGQAERIARDWIRGHRAETMRIMAEQMDDEPTGLRREGV